MAKRSSPFTESTPCFPPEGWGEVTPNPRGTGMAPDHHLTITRRRAPPPCSILPHPARTWGPSQGLAQWHPKSTCIKNNHATNQATVALGQGPVTRLSVAQNLPEEQSYWKQHTQGFQLLTCSLLQFNTSGTQYYVFLHFKSSYLTAFLIFLP